MNTLKEYYTTKLYPLQDKVLGILENTNSPFYLTGGTALGRAYLLHRYSDDLDFFLNADKEFEQKVQQVFDTLKKHFGSHLTISLSYDSFARCFVNENEVNLKIEFVNDVRFRVGGIQKTQLFTNTDNIQNILSNKICALSREQAKDVSDIWYIANNFIFNWKEVIENAKNKDLWVDETEVLIMLEKFDVNTLEQVNWINDIDIQKAKNDMKVIIQDILLGKDNSLCKS